MNIQKFIYLAGMPAVMALAVASCGGGSGQVGSAASGGLTGVAVNSGPITGFGSVFVNGVEYNTANAKVQLNGNAGIPDDLKVGMIVKVTGHVDDNGTTGTAQEIDYNSNVRGIVDSVDPAKSTFVVMGQTVLVDNLTVFDGTTLAMLAAGNIVEVSGSVDSNGVIHASHVELIKSAFAQGDQLDIRGTISNLDTTNKTFDIGSQTINYSNAALNGVPSGPRDGMTVLVKSTQGLNAKGQLVASAVEGISNDFKAEEGKEIEIKGLVSAFTSASDFSVNGQAVQTTSQTEFEGGSASMIALNIRVEVEGAMDANGVLIATSIKIEPQSAIEVAGDVEAVDATNGTVTVLGEQFTVTANTEYRDESSAQEHYFRIKDIAVGDYLDVRGYASGTTLIATRIERTNPVPGGLVEVQGALTSLNAPNLGLLGLTVVTDGTTTFDLADASTASATFFSTAAVGDVVDVKGTLLGDGTVQATRVDDRGSLSEDGTFSEAAEMSHH